MTPHFVPAWFQENNAPGFTIDQLAELNRRFDRAVDSHIPPCPDLDEFTATMLLREIGEQILAEYEREQATAPASRVWMCHNCGRLTRSKGDNLECSACGDLMFCKF